MNSSIMLHQVSPKTENAHEYPQETHDVRTTMIEHINHDAHQLDAFTAHWLMLLHARIEDLVLQQDKVRKQQNFYRIVIHRWSTRRTNLARSKAPNGDVTSVEGAIDAKSPTQLTA